MIIRKDNGKKLLELNEKELTKIEHYNQYYKTIKNNAFIFRKVVLYCLCTMSNYV